jgi:uncharacterized surface protein with fasciclin (FAS1) repeats
MPTHFCTSQSAKLAALAGFASLSTLSSLPATAQMETNQPASNTPSQQLPLKANFGVSLLAQVGARSIADELRIANDAFSTLNAAVGAAGLTQALAGRGPFTVFAPTDEAFRRLPAGTVQSLLRPENRGKLAQILTYHVVSGDINSFSLRPGSVVRLTTLEGRPLTVRVTNASEIFVNGAKVILADIPARNGTIHGISSVLLP